MRRIIITAMCYSRNVTASTVSLPIAVPFLFNFSLCDCQLKESFSVNYGNDQFFNSQKFVTYARLKALFDVMNIYYEYFDVFISYEYFKLWNPILLQADVPVEKSKHAQQYNLLYVFDPVNQWYFMKFISLKHLLYTLFFSAFPLLRSGKNYGRLPDFTIWSLSSYRIGAKGIFTYILLTISPLLI